jgi:hypothetical protein
MLDNSITFLEYTTLACLTQVVHLPHKLIKYTYEKMWIDRYDILIDWSW